MKPRRLSKRDFDQIVEVIDRWWGGPLGTFAHPMFFYELGEHALVVEDGGEMIGFLLGFIAHPSAAPEESPPGLSTLTGYVHLVGIHPDFRRRGVGRVLYQSFTETCQALGCKQLKAITTTGNEGSLRFHLALGWRAEEIDDYAGPGRRRVVFTRDFDPATN